MDDKEVSLWTSTAFARLGAEAYRPHLLKTGTPQLLAEALRIHMSDRDVVARTCAAISCIAEDQDGRIMLDSMGIVVNGHKAGHIFVH